MCAIPSLHNENNPHCQPPASASQQHSPRRQGAGPNRKRIRATRCSTAALGRGLRVKPANPHASGPRNGPLYRRGSLQDRFVIHPALSTPEGSNIHSRGSNQPRRRGADSTPGTPSNTERIPEGCQSQPTVSVRPQSLLNSMHQRDAMPALIPNRSNGPHSGETSGSQRVLSRLPDESLI